MSKNTVLGAAGIFAVLMLFSAVCHSQDDFDFRHAHWGASKEDVIKSEDKKPEIVNDDFVGYDEVIDGKNVKLGYSFIDNKLYAAVYYLISKHTNKYDYISDYESFEKLLTEKYGKPKERKTIWKNNLYKNDPQQWGMAVSIGHLTKFAKWETKNSDILEVLDGENFECRVFIRYASKDLSKKAAMAEKNKEKSKL